MAVLTADSGPAGCGLSVHTAPVATALLERPALNIRTLAEMRIITGPTGIDNSAAQRTLPLGPGCARSAMHNPAEMQTGWNEGAMRVVMCTDANSQRHGNWLRQCLAQCATLYDSQLWQRLAGYLGDLRKAAIRLHTKDQMAKKKDKQDASEASERPPVR